MTMIVQFEKPMPITNSACCNNSHVMCDRCAAAALNTGGSHPVQKPEPMGLPVWNFESEDQGKPAGQPKAPTPTINHDQPTPLGLPVWEF